MTAEQLTVAVTGPTGTLGFGLVPLLQAHERIGRIVGVARRRFDPAAHGWSKLEYRQGDVRDPAALESAFEGTDVVIHLAFQVIGNDTAETIRQVNVEGTVNAFRAAAAAGARRFVVASSVAAYGFHRDNPVGMAEDWPVRPAARLFYAREKAELEHLLAAESAACPALDLYLLRPSIVLGPHTLGAKQVLPRPLEGFARFMGRMAGRLPIPVAVADLPVQFVHELDVGRALLLCAAGAGPPGAYNIAADDVLSTVDVVRELGLIAIPVPGGPVRSAARLVSALPTPSWLPPAVQWVEAASHPAIMDTGKAKAVLGWRPRYTALEALRQTIDAALHPR